MSSTNITGWSLDYHCYAVDINGEDTWTYVVTVSDTYSTRGWVNDDDLRDHGSFKRCIGDTNQVESAPANIDWAATNKAALV
ncbi:hypothetical protein [Actinoplanes sp. NPDC026619]|uniref:hypothetical protein n=1 Tax=Actinoplanes sp. NPDC026619 TaxID=3155798 RepID=UPI0033FA02F0